MSRIAVFATLLVLLFAPWAEAEPILLCGADTVFEVDSSAAASGKVERRWSWTAKASPQLPEALHRTFASTDDCKPLAGGARILICSSSGGCALVERRSGVALWYAQVPNAHSLELLPRDRIVVASSVNAQGNRLVLFDVARSNQPIWSGPLVSAHGVVWDDARQLLWALGLAELQCYTLKDWDAAKPALALKASYALPDQGGHDLQPVPGSHDLVVTSGRQVFLFDRETRTFRVHPQLGGRHHVKSVNIHPLTGQTAFIQASDQAWWSDTLHLLAPAGQLQLPGQRLYKARWLVPSGQPAKATAAPPKPLFRFVQVNDLHVQATEPAPTPRQRTYTLANEKARWLVETIGSLVPAPELVVGVGDLIHGEALDRLAPDLRTLGEILNPLRVPLYPVVGNHEVVQQERSPQFQRPWQTVLARDRTDYTFAHGGILFVALNNSGAPSADAARQRNQWLREVLAASQAQPKIILCHIPLIALRDEATLAKSFGFISYRDLDPGTLNLLEEHRNSVIAVLSGHLHLTGVKQRQGIYHVSIAGTASYPSDFAVYDVFPDRIEVAVRQLPARMAQSAPSIHGKPRHGQDFTDTEHRTAEEYQSGRADERRFAIPLAGVKRPRAVGRTSP